MKKTNKFKIAIGQFSPSLGDISANLRAVAQWCRKAKARGAKALVLPELALNGYLLEELAGDTAFKRHSAGIKKIALASRGLQLVLGGVFEEKNHAIYNSGLHFDRGQLAGIQHKMYLPSYGMFDEARYFQQGNDLELFDWGPFKAVMLLCEDAWHASLPLLAVQRGANLIVVLASSPARDFQAGGKDLRIQRTWKRILGAMAETLGVYVVFSNRVGVEDGIGFWGGSLVYGPQGETLAEAPCFKEILLEAELDLSAIRQARVAAPLAALERLDYNARAFASLAGWTLQPDKKTQRRKS